MTPLLIIFCYSLIRNPEDWPLVIMLFIVFFFFFIFTVVDKPSFTIIVPILFILLQYYAWVSFESLLSGMVQ